MAPKLCTTFLVATVLMVMVALLIQADAQVAPDLGYQTLARQKRQESSQNDSYSFTIILKNDIAELKQASEEDNLKLQKLVAAVELMGVSLKGSQEDKSQAMQHAIQTESPAQGVAPIERSVSVDDMGKQMHLSERRLEMLTRKVSSKRIIHESCITKSKSCL